MESDALIAAVDEVATFRDEAAACPPAFPFAPAFLPLTPFVEFPLLKLEGVGRKKRKGTRS